MINRERLVNNFIDMVKVDSPSKQELEMAKYLVAYLKERGIDATIDNAGEAFGGNSGNLIAYIKGQDSENPICFSAHMDQVTPCIGVKPIREGNIVKTDGTTTLGADDKAGIAAVLEALETIKEGNVPHRDIYFLFTACEEAGLLGAKNFKADSMPCKNIVILDAGGPAGTIAYKAPAQENVKVTLHGRKAHAGMEPEKGINAIVVASHAISNMHIGRLDELTTSNIGRIEGGGATNVVTDEVSFTGEIRSHIPERLAEEIAHMEKCCEEAAAKFNATVDFTHQNMYPSFELSKDSYVYKLTEEALLKIGVEPNPMIIGGGSDANIIANLGYNCAIVSCGMNQVHTVNEYVDIDDMEKASNMVYHMMAL